MEVHAGSSILPLRVLALLDPPPSVMGRFLTVCSRLVCCIMVGSSEEVVGGMLGNLRLSCVRLPNLLRKLIDLLFPTLFWLLLDTVSNPLGSFSGLHLLLAGPREGDVVYVRVVDRRRQRVAVTGV